MFRPLPELPHRILTNVLRCGIHILLSGLIQIILVIFIISQL